MFWEGLALFLTRFLVLVHNESFPMGLIIYMKFHILHKTCRLYNFWPWVHREWDSIAGSPWDVRLGIELLSEAPRLSHKDSFLCHCLASRGQSAPSHPRCWPDQSESSLRTAQGQPQLVFLPRGHAFATLCSLWRYKLHLLPCALSPQGLG